MLLREVRTERLSREELLKELSFMNELTQGEYSHSLARQKRNHQACRQIDELIMNYDMVQQYKDEKEAEQAEIELCYVDIIIDLYEQLESEKEIDYD